MPPNRRRPGRNKPTAQDQKALYAAFMNAILDNKDVVAMGWKDETGLHFEQNTGAQMKSVDGPRVIAKTTDLYFTPCPQTSEFDTERNPNGRMRGQGMALPGRCCWVDCDEGLTDTQLAMAKKIGAFVVESGSVTEDGRPRYHLYFPLDAPTDPRVIRWLNIQLRDKFNGDHKHDPASILRIPNTFNHKTSPARPVPIVHATSTRNAPESLAKALGVEIPPDEELGDLDSAEAASRKDVNAYLEECSEVDPDKDGPIKGYVRNFRTALLDTGSRHTAMMQVLPWALREAGEGKVNAQTALDELRGRFAKALNNTPGRSADNEFDSMVAWALGQVRVEQKREAEEAEERVNTMRGRMLTTKQLRNRPNPRYLIEGVLDHNTLGRSVGAPGAGKTFGALSMAMRVAQGEDWYGHRVMKGPVVYLVAEGVDGFKKRVWAWEEMFGDIPDDQILFLPEPVQVMENPWKDFITVCADIQPVMIVLDTQARITLGIEENANSEMGHVVQRLDSLRNATRAHVHLVHHTGHEQKRGRGASAVLGAVDTELIYSKEKAEGDGWIFRLENQKQKDSAEAGDMFFMPEVVELGKDEDERMMSSLVFHSTAGRPATTSDRQAAKEHKANRIQAAILNFLESNPSCSMRRVRVAVMKSAECGQKLFEQELLSLEQDGYVQNVGTGTNNKWVRTNKAEKHTIEDEKESN